MAAEKNESLLAERLDRLFRSSRPEGRPWTNDEVAARLKQANPKLRVSGAYLSALRNGKRERPSPELLAALARFFGVKSAYFFDQGSADQALNQLAMLDELHQAGVRSIALRAAGLPPESLTAVMSVLDEIRKLQGLPPVEE
ncbi:helix-turn-helix domain-containing protein [Streptomyces sp. NPDC052040]|uniref:helix-turn-helix domain-containing protein n=1 Tax=unclassified Streptomyces TaxID=2593676 RepID=UPI0037D20931